MDSGWLLLIFDKIKGTFAIRNVLWLYGHSQWPLHFAACSSESPLWHFIYIFYFAKSRKLNVTTSTKVSAVLLQFPCCLDVPAGDKQHWVRNLEHAESGWTEIKWLDWICRYWGTWSMSVAINVFRNRLAWLCVTAPGLLVQYWSQVTGCLFFSDNWKWMIDTTTVVGPTGPNCKSINYSACKTKHLLITATYMRGLWVVEFQLLPWSVS